MVDKPAGMSSHAVVARVRKWYGTSKVGHSGTLDPMATGVLVLGLGRATRLLTYLVGQDKTYSATIRLGVGTPSDDADSEPDRFADAQAVAGLTEDAIRQAAARFTGAIEQVPSAVSAIKVDGQRAYKLVRDGQKVDLRPRPVMVSRFEVGQVCKVQARYATPVDSADPANSATPVECVDVDVQVDCSSGTYIRALARDVGELLGVYGHLTRLRRERVGAFTVAGAVALPSAEVVAGQVPPEPAALLSLAAVAGGIMPTVELSAGEALAVTQGKFVPVPDGGIDGQAGEFGEQSGVPDQAQGQFYAGVFGGALVAVLKPVAGMNKLKVATGFMTPDDIYNQ